MASSLIGPTAPISAPTRSTLPRRSSSLCKQVITKLRPMPFQYVWSFWYCRSNGDYTPRELAEEVADIGAFYRIFNNFPWESVRLKDSVHFFRLGVKPVWEDEENLGGGCWTIKVQRENDKALRAWEEICLMTCGGELQAEIASERDHVLGISYSPRLYWAHIAIWTKQGQNETSINKLQQLVLSRLSNDLQPASATEYYYKRHAEHGDFQSNSSGQALAINP